MWKRASAYLFDMILLATLAVALGVVLSLLLGYDGYNSTLEAAYDKYETQFGIQFDMTAEEFAAMTEEQKTLYDQAYDALLKDEEAMFAYNMVLNLSLIITTLALLAAYLLLEFMVPLLLKNGQTLGKKIFGIAVMHIQGVKLGHVALFTRTVLGKYAVETMPLALSALYLISGLGSPVFLLIGAALLLVQLIVVIVSHENALLHDKMAVTVTVDLASQMIFDTYDQLLEYKKKMHAEKAASQPY